MNNEQLEEYKDCIPDFLTDGDNLGNPDIQLVDSCIDGSQEWTDDTRVWRVWYFAKYDTYIKFYGFFSSYDGIEYQGYVEVKPKQITKTIYE